MLVLGLVHHCGESGKRIPTSGLSTVQWLDAAGKRQPLLAKPCPYGGLRLSPDGKRLALVGSGADQAVLVYDPQRDSTTRLTFGGGPYSVPVWTPDGSYILFSSPGGCMLWTRADGAGQPQPLGRTENLVFPWSLTPDRKHLAYYKIQSGNPQIWTTPVEEQGGQLKTGRPDQFLKTQSQDLLPAFSPDGSWLAYQSNASGKSEVYVRPFRPSASSQGGLWVISTNGGTVPVWSRATHELL